MATTKLCSKCNQELGVAFFNKDKTKKDGLYSCCKHCKGFKGKNKKIIYTGTDAKEKRKQYRQMEHVKKREREYHRRYVQERVKTDLLFKLRLSLQTRLAHFLRRSEKFNLKSDFQKYLGCTLEQLKAHLESKFVDGMSWENRDKWHIDHITPLCSAKTETDLTQLCHYTNLQPLWAEDNLKKNGKVPSNGK